MRDKDKSEKPSVGGGALEKGPLILFDEGLKAEKYAMYSRKIAYLYSKRSGKPNWRAKSGSNRCWEEEEPETFTML
jgi:hypothetical protein